MQTKCFERHDLLHAITATRPRMQILIESATESEWVARHLESLGHEVIVADPNYAPMYATRSRVSDSLSHVFRQFF